MNTTNDEVNETVPKDSGSANLYNPTSLDIKLQQFSKDIFSTVTKIVDGKLSILQKFGKHPREDK